MLAAFLSRDSLPALAWTSLGIAGFLLLCHGVLRLWYGFWRLWYDHHPPVESYCHILKNMNMGEDRHRPDFIEPYWQQAQMEISNLHYPAATLRARKLQVENWAVGAAQDSILRSYDLLRDEIKQGNLTKTGVLLRKIQENQRFIMEHDAGRMTPELAACVARAEILSRALHNTQSQTKKMAFR